MPVDFATIAAGYGCKTWRVTTLDELRQALDAARRETVSTLIDIKVLPKTMVHKYGSWWKRRRGPDGALRADPQSRRGR
ncbi:3D-(3,5/4)-trihydroxycyclohexane-1,2-dione hydrolase [Raoultella terrigena]|uniref:3D-(3,5/4)-trihydroxycyclohexane-1,2-dione hydrolase n=1 Tax=Raoultella terrigena TaxID=577 RepID=A0A3P8M5U5_RAOTE|nr:3D-(3,5/4)-trihydroxycyclohexane-1,2-dione hydrolase [Raoultella terrigena]